MECISASMATSLHQKQWHARNAQQENIVYSQNSTQLIAQTDIMQLAVILDAVLAQPVSSVTQLQRLFYPQFVLLDIIPSQELQHAHNVLQILNAFMEESIDAHHHTIQQLAPLHVFLALMVAFALRLHIYQLQLLIAQMDIMLLN